MNLPNLFQDKYILDGILKNLKRIEQENDNEKHSQIAKYLLKRLKPKMTEEEIKDAFLDASFDYTLYSKTLEEYNKVITTLVPLVFKKACPEERRKEFETIILHFEQQ